MSLGISGVAASQMEHAQIKNEASVAVAKKALDANKMQGKMALQLLEGAKPPAPTATRGNLVNTYM